METFVIIILIASFVFGIYIIIKFNSPDDNLKKGIKHLENKKYQTANEIFIKLIGKHKQAEEKLSESYFKETVNKNSEQAYFLFQKAIEIKPEGEYSKKAGEELAKIHYQKAKIFQNTGNKPKATEELKKVVEWTKNQISNTKDSANYDLAEYQLERGIELERKNDCINAIREYNKVADFTVQIVSDQLKTKSANLISDTNCRIAISQLKIGITPEQNIIDNLKNRKSRYSDDFFFRLALLFAKNENINKAEEYIKFIENENNELKKLKTYCFEYYKKIALKEIEHINQELFSEDFLILKNLLDKLNKNLKILDMGLPQFSVNIKETSLYLYSKLINIFFEKEDYEGLITHILQLNKFYKHPELLKNLGLASLRIAGSGQLNSSNYQLVCSIWLTAVYSDKVILNSLDETTWDDEYTFTLANSIGCYYHYDIDIENVNFEEPNENNICIGTTQKELVQLFENELNNIHDEKLLKKVHIFYNSEKTKLENVIKYIKKQIVFAPPYLAKKYKMNDYIISELTTAFTRDQIEEIIQTGLSYVTDEKPKIFEDYQIAQNFINNTVDSIKKRNLSTLKYQNNSEYRNSINKFPKLIDKFENEVIKAFATLIQQYEDDENIVNLFDVTIDLSPSKIQLKYQAASFLIDMSVSKLNNDKISHEQGLIYLVKAYLYNSENKRIADNLAIVSKFNCMKMLKEGISENCKNSLKEIVRIKNPLLTNSLRSEIGEILNDVLIQFRKKDPQLADLMEREIGLSKSRRQGHLGILDDIIANSHEINRASLNYEGKKLAEKLKLIKDLIE